MQRLREPSCALPCGALPCVRSAGAQGSMPQDHRDGSTALFYTTAFIRTEGSVGTCFFVCKDELAEFSGGWIVTNKHVLEGGPTASFSMHRKDGKGLQEFTTLRSDWIDHPGDIDLSLLSLAALSIKTGVHLNTLDVVMLPLTCVPSLAELEANCKGIEQVTLIGYPYGIYDDVNYLPVARRGTTAMPPWVDWKGKPELLVDIAGHRGNSGGPLLIFDYGNYTDRAGTLVGGKGRIFLLGVFSSVYDQDGTFPLNLGVCIRGTLIRDMIARYSDTIIVASAPETNGGLHEIGSEKIQE